MEKKATNKNRNTKKNIGKKTIFTAHEEEEAHLVVV
jgi:hypothetical protein